jgi:thiol-disulfide isomerase/thioredoxin
MSMAGSTRRSPAGSATRPNRPIVAVLAVAVLAGCSGHRPAGSQASGTNVVGITRYAPSDRQSAPVLTGSTLGGEPLSVQAAGRGKIVLLNVWASWCGPCRSESPMLATEAKSFASAGVVFVGLDEQDDATKARAFATSTGMSYASLVDDHGSLLGKLKMLPQMGIPSTLLLDRHGRIAARVIGPITSAQVTSTISALQAET